MLNEGVGSWTARRARTAALNMLCLPTMLKGGSVLIEPAFDPARVLELIARYRVTSMFGVPASYDAMAAAPGWADAGCRTSSPMSGRPVRTRPRPGPASGARSSWPART